MPTPSRQPRLALFTDTLGDVNGVSRFINDILDQSLAAQRPLHVLTSTRFPTRPLPTIHNLPPLFARAMPGYPQLELAAPNIPALLRRVRQIEPDLIHVSTPGPVGLVGVLASRLLRVPLLGTYHTDFPAYIADLFDDDPAFNALTRAAMRTIYRRFDTIFTRSDDYARTLHALHVHPRSMPRLWPGTRLDRFAPTFRDPSIWPALALPTDSLKILYVGRLSVEKNMPMLVRVWRATHAILQARGLSASLILVGDGPHRPEMQRELEGCNTHFLGFRYNEELSRLYASSDLFLFPSVTDTLGQVVMEAQASGLPALVTNVGGPQEIVRHQQTGLVLSPDHQQAWVDAIVDLVADATKRKAMGQAAHEHLQSFSIAASFEHFWDVHVEAWRRSIESHSQPLADATAVKHVTAARPAKPSESPTHVAP
ncbi:MAG: glycosyltransferase family 1 protein [Phycisphaerales bacterium]|nr:glycosyltransferase family 1 protein [Phycisphaerales bacterium]